MIGIIICSHSDFAIGLKNACEMIAGEQPCLEAVSFDGHEDLSSYSERIKSIAAQYDNGCLFVCDLVNGTPFNYCLLAIAGTENVVLTGASLPLLLELLIKRNNSDLTSEQLALEVMESSKNYVVIKHSRDIFD